MPVRTRAIRRSGRFTVLLLFVLLVAACGSVNATSGAPASIAPTAPTTTAAPTTTTIRRDVPGSQLPPGAATIHVLGDSVTLGSKASMPGAFPGWTLTFDSKESRRIDQGTDIVKSANGIMGRVLVVHLCTNWGGNDFGAAAADLMASLTNVDRVVWVTCTPWIPAVDSADDAIRALPSLYPNVVVADWAAISRTPGYTYDDGLHLKTAGSDALAALIAATVGPTPLPG
jgi:hypothetical protein